ncbi:Xaa-Pro aminopeptidase [Methanomicrobium sp. W14]|uniref:M24 family metallopeptidase n=1 Tax=Methanomicrobium sp. W14 TaxID=2817839 RepID=UPI001AEA9BE2|nr:Xaa-Pro peptidase family protein [Methanomicrobium sp. W14]MBP2133798.1 Xaa-Pro aminopeptidase [Methanomicrobium sp. W14]
MINSLDQSLEAANSKAYVMVASSENPDMRYLTGFSVTDPLIYIRRHGGRGQLIVPQMEKDRALSESKCDVITRGEAGYFDYLKSAPDPYTAQAEMISYVAGGDILVPADFPVILARELEKFCRVSVDRGTVEKMRSVKTPGEIEKIRECQKANDAVMEFAVNKISAALVKNGELYDGKTRMTSSYLRGEIECFLLKRGFLARDTIVSCGTETAMPHCTGKGVLLENEPILMDIFPSDLKTGYYSDMTRTVVKGEPSPEIEDIFKTVSEAKKLGENMVSAGITGKSVHDAVSKFFEESGYHTGTEGFVHSLGHGVGLAIHESPSLSPSGGELECGNIVTVEPGLYYRKYGGVRLEDMGLVEKNGFDCFTKSKEELRV